MTWAAAGRAAVMISVVCSSVDEVARLVPHAQFTQVRHCNWDRSGFSHLHNHVSILSRLDVTTDQHARRVRKTFSNQQNSFINVITQLTLYNVLTTTLVFPYSTQHAALRLYKGAFRSTEWSHLISPYQNWTELGWVHYPVQFTDEMTSNEIVSTSNINTWLKFY